MATTSNTPAPARSSRGDWFKRITPRDVSTKLFMAQLGLSVLAIIIIGFGLLLSGVGETVDLQYGVFLDRASILVMVGTIIMMILPVKVVVAEKAWLRLGLLVAILLVMSPLLFPLFMGLFAPLGKLLGAMGFPLLLALFLHAYLMYWVGFQGAVSGKVKGLQKTLEMRDHEAYNARAQAGPLQATAEQGKLDAKNAKQAEDAAEKKLTKAQEEATKAREAHDQFKRADTTVPAAQSKFDLAERQLETKRKAMQAAHDRLEKGPGKNGPTQQELQDQFDDRQNAFLDYQAGDYARAEQELLDAKQALETSPTAQAATQRALDEQRASAALVDAKSNRVDADAVYSKQLKQAGAASRAADNADKAVQKVRDKLQDAQKAQSGQRATWLLVTVLLLLGTVACYSGYWGAILNRV